jgi:hypothetical protein
MLTISHKDLVCPVNGQLRSGPVPAARVLRPLPTRSQLATVRDDGRNA